MAAYFDSWTQDQHGDSSGPGHGVTNFLTDDIRVALIDTGTTDPAIATHQDWADLSSALIGSIVQLLSPAFALASNLLDFDAADTVIPSVASGSAEELVLFDYSSATAATAGLIIQWDSGDVTNLPVTANGGDITVVWHVDGILRF